MPQAAARPTPVSPWIISRASDLSCFVLSPLYSVALLGLFLLTLHLFQAEPAATERAFFFLFLILLDRPHIVQTFSRTHFDPVERKRRPLLHRWLLGAALVYTALWPDFTNHDYYRFFFGLFGLWHIYAQNMGFLKLYGRRSAAPFAIAEAERWAFRLFYWAYFFKVAGRDVGAEYPTLELCFLTMNRAFLGASVLALVLLAFRWRKAERLRESFREPRFLLFLCLGLCYGVNYVAVSFVPVLAMVVFDTLYHDIQYLRWTAHYQQKTFSRRNIAWLWLGAGLAVSLVVFYGEDFARFNLGIMLPLWAVFGVATVYHYLVDGFIWKFATQPELGKVLAK